MAANYPARPRRTAGDILAERERRQERRVAAGETNGGDTDLVWEFLSQIAPVFDDAAAAARISKLIAKGAAVLVPVLGLLVALKQLGVF